MSLLYTKEDCRGSAGSQKLLVEFHFGDELHNPRTVQGRSVHLEHWKCRENVVSIFREWQHAAGVGGGVWGEARLLKFNITVCDIKTCNISHVFHMIFYFLRKIWLPQKNILQPLHWGHYMSGWHEGPYPPCTLWQLHVPPCRWKNTNCSCGRSCGAWEGTLTSGGEH